MPSLNVSLPALPGLAIGILPVVPDPLPTVGAGGGSGDFAAMMAPPEGPPAPDIITLSDNVPTLPPGTDLPVPRQQFAGPPEPPPEVAVETVMIGTTAPSPDAGAIAAPVSPPLPPAPTEDAPPELGECRIEPAHLGALSHRAITRPAATPPAPSTPQQPTVALPAVQKDAGMAVPAEPTADDDDMPQPAAGEDASGEPVESAKAMPLPPQAQPPFIPIEWPRPPAPPALPTLPPAPDNADTEAPAIAASRPLSAGSTPKPILPGVTATAVESTPESVAQSTQSQPPQARETGHQPSAPPATARPSPQPTALPHDITIPPELAREVAELVRATVRDHGDSAPSATINRIDAPTPPLTTPQPTAAAPLHRDFAMSNRPMIDTSRAEWMQAMIERIAEMPQVDGKREAQIRLRPDALGTVEVRIEQRQDRLHVTMNADNPQARQLLAESAPRLHELAEARGLRLGQTGIGGGESHDRRPAPEQQDQPLPLRPRPASAATAESETDTGDDLIA